MTTPTLAQALQRRVFDQQLACRSHGNCFVACALHDFWCQVAIVALCEHIDDFGFGNVPAWL